MTSFVEMSRRRRSIGAVLSPPERCSKMALVVLLAVTVSSLGPAQAFSTHRQQQIDNLLGNAHEHDGSDIEEIKHVEKRESKGTCTCTCETRPAATADHQLGATSGVVPQLSASQGSSRIPTASLIRTAASMKDSASKLKPQQNPAANSQPKASQRTEAKPITSTSNSYGHIVQVPPMPDDYESIVNELNPGGRNNDHYDESNEQKESENEQARNGNQDWSVDGSERWPWERLPDTICLRQQCTSNRNCCRRYNICDKSANVCIDCWHGSACTSERDCCMAYKFCKREWKTNPDTGQSVIVGGKCVSSL